MVPQETVPWVVMVSRVILDSVEILASLAVKGLPDPKEMMESLEIQAQTTVSQDLPGPKGPKATEDLRGDRDLLGRLDLLELMNVRFWTSS